ncbi:LEPR-XLL domain-containing protein [Marinobacterium nitratireducens]|uniref:LEPR-XLL domain-containing protein n=1 Tax=Marinobacterium nitratireducens TaxID=518897 RepID=UPI0016631AEB|nr:LEPR-XLL domain-containing protein [Marinobacterium nitratireducens]
MPSWQCHQKGRDAGMMEALEPRLLLSADFMPAAADVMAEGFDDLQDKLQDFFDGAAELEERVPFLLLEDPDYDTENPDPDDAPIEAPTFEQLFEIPVDANGDGEINNPLFPFDTSDDDESTLQQWDNAGIADGIVDASEMLDALLFQPLQDVFDDIEVGDETADFVTALEGDGFLIAGFDVELLYLGGDYTLGFEVSNVTDLTEEPDAEVAFSFQFSLSIMRPEVVVDFGLEADELKLLAFQGDSLDPDPVTLPVDSTITFGIEFGVYTGGQEEADLGQEDFFIRRADDMVFSVTASDNNFNFDLNIGFLGAQVVGGDVDFQADILATLVDPDSPEVLGFDSAQYGVEQTSGVVTAANALPSSNLDHDAGFVLRIGNIGIATDVLVEDTDAGDNNTLIAEIEAALDTAGLGGLFEVDLSGGGELRFSLVDTNAGALGFNAESLNESGVLTAAGTPPLFQPLENVSLLLSVGGAIPRLVTMRAPGSERDDIGFAATEISVLNPLMANNSANASGNLDEGGDSEANFELTITEMDGTVTVAAISVEESDAPGDPNGSVADLVADINDALADAGVDTLVSASQSGGVISLTGSGSVGSIVISDTDPVTENDIGFELNQQTLLSLTASGNIGDVTFDDGLDNTFDDARFTIEVNETEYDIDVPADDSRSTAAELAAAIDTALSNAGLAVSASVDSNHIVLSADDASVYSLSVTTGNDNLSDLLYDLNNALDAAGLSDITASDDGGGHIRLSAAGGESLEISHTLTFDAGVRGAELDGDGTVPDATFESSVGEDSELTFTLPVEVKEGLREYGTTSDWDPQDMAIVGSFNPLDSDIASFVVDEPDNEDPGTDPQEVLRFFLDFDITPESGDDPPIAIPAPPGDNTLQLVNFAEALQFNQIGPGSFVGMLGELGQALDSIMQNPLFAGYGIPFVDATLRDLVAFEDMILNSLVYDKGVDNEFDDEGYVDDGTDTRLLVRSPVGDVIIPDGENDEANTFELLPTFTTAQEMGAILAEILSLPLFSGDVALNTGGINPTYDPGTNELTYDMDLISSDRVSVGVDDPDNPDDDSEIFGSNFEFDVDLAPFAEFLIKPEGLSQFGGSDPITVANLQALIEARTTFSATYGFDLSPPLDIDPEWDPDPEEGEADRLLEERFFVRDATLGGAFIATLPDVGVEASALVGIIGVDITDIDGSFGAQFSAQLKAEGGAAGSQVTLEAIQQDIQETSLGPTEGDDSADGFPTPGDGSDYAGGQEALEIVTDPVVSKLQTLDYDDQTIFDPDFVAGSRIVSGSGGTAYVLAVDDEFFAGTGTLTVFGVQGDFNDNDDIIDVRDVVGGGGDREADVDGGLVTPTFFGELEMDILVRDGFTGTGYGPEIAELDGIGGTIDLNIAVFGNPNTDTDPQIDSGDLVSSLAAIGTDVDGNFVSLADYVDIGYFDLIAALEQLGELVAELEAAYPVLNQTLPVVNMTVSELLGLTEGVDRAVALARVLLENQQDLLDVPGEEVPTLTLQSLAGALRDAFGLAPDDGVSLVVDIETVDGTPYLTLDFDIEETVSTSLGLDIDLGPDIPNLTSGKVLRADGSLGWGFKVGIALDNSTYVEADGTEHIVSADFKLFNPEGGLDGQLSIVGEGAEGVGLVFLAQVGTATVQVMDALVDIELDFDLGGLDFSGTDGIKTLADVDFGDFVPNITTQDYDVSIPLFDISAGLTGFLGEISANGTDLIDDASNLLDSLLDTSALDELEDTIGDLVDSLEDFDPLENLLLLTDAADLFFETLQGLLDKATTVPIPLIGDKLAEGARFIDQFRDQFIDQFRQLVEFTNDIELEDVTDYINDFFAGIGLDVVEVVGDLMEGDIGDQFDDEIRWMLSLGDTYSVPFGYDFDAGIPLLNLHSDVAVEIGIEWELDIGFGVNLQDGAFIILEDVYGPGNEDDKGELEVRAFIDLPEGTPFRGTLGFLEVEITNNGSGMELDFGLDLSNEGAADPTLLPIADIGNLGVEVMVGGGALEGNDNILDFDLTVGITDTDFIIPKLATSLVMDWSLAEVAQDSIDNFIQEGLNLLEFGEVQIDLSSMFGGLIGDVLSELEVFLGPLQEINDFLNADIPIISDLFGPTSLLDIAELLGLADTRLFEALDAIDTILDTLGDLSGMITLTDAISLFDADNIPDADFADFLFDPDLDFTKALEDSFGDLTSFLASTGENLVGNFTDAVLNSDVPGTSKSAFTDTTNLSIGGADELIKLPWLDDPTVLIGLLFSQDVSLIEVDLPPLGVGFDYDQFVTIFGPLGVSIGFGFFVGADLSLGFNTYGFQRFADSNYTNPALIFDGFFLGDRENVTEGADIEELFMELTLTAAAELNLAIATAGVGGGITARLGLDLYDPDSDGAVHISELINSIDNELRDGGNAGTDVFKAIFDLQGAILAELFWYLSINLGITELEFGDTIFGPEEIFTFEFTFNRSPVLATEVDTDGNDDADVLIINAGPNSIDRLNGDVSDGDEVFEVEYDGGDILIRSSSLGVNDWQRYSNGYDHIIFLGGEGNDSITFTGFDESNITFNLQGGAGDDVIQFVENLGILTPATGAGAVILGGTGNDTLIGSHLNDRIFGGRGNDTIGGGRGYDILIGDQAILRDEPEPTIGVLVSVLDGDDTINGGDDDDIIFGGGGEDDLHGDAGADIIIGDGGRFSYQLTDGHIDISAFDIDEFNPNDRLDPDPAVSTMQQMQNILLSLGAIFSGTNLGGGADDTIDGGDGNDIIFGGAANDTISGGNNDDHIVGGTGFDLINGDDGNDVLFGNEQDDIINGGAGSDVISGGFGDDFLHGDEGNDYMAGSRGRDIMFGDEGDDEMHGEGEPDIMFGGEDNDLVIGGVGADIIMGDDGIVVKFDDSAAVASGDDLIIGDGDHSLADAYEAAADLSIGSLDLILTHVRSTDGDDILSGGEGGDLIFGGGGNDLGGGDVDPRRTTANDETFTTPDGDDVLIGDGGVVEFNQRRLQRIASVFAGDPDISYRDTLYGDNGNDIIIGGRGSDGDDNGDDPTLNIPSLGIGFMLTGGHGPGRGATDPEVSDADIIIGDNGELVYVGPSDENFGQLAYIQTTDTSNATGGADTAFGEEDNDIILGGVNGSVDVLSGSTGEDVILGDNGLIHFYYDWENDPSIEDYATEDYLPNDGDTSTIDLIRSFHDGLGGIDIVSGEQGSDVLMGGEEGDFVYGDNATASSGSDDLGDIMLGDNGDIFLEGDVGLRMVQGVAVDFITTTDVSEGTGGADIMSGNAGADVIIGGVNDGGIDQLYGDARTPVPGLDGDDTLLGDNGLLDYTWDAIFDTDRNTLDLIATTAQAGGGVRGGVDYIFGNAGSDTAFGGSGGDRIFGDNDESVDGSGDADLHGALGGSDILVGDQGRVELVNNLVTFITSTDLDSSEGGIDHIQGNDYGDYIIGGVAGDELHGEAFLTPGEGVADLVVNAGNDTILGDQGRMRFDVSDSDPLVSVTAGYSALGDGDPLTLDLVETFATGNADLGGSDQIYGNDGGDVAMGGAVGDLIHGDFYLGDSGLVRALNPGNDDLLGDGGQKYFQNGHVILLRSHETDQGGSDEIHGNDGNDTIIGGYDDDLLYGETDLDHLVLAAGRAGEDVMLGDNGRLDWTLPDDDILGRQDVIDEFGGTLITVDPVAVPADGWATLDRITTIAPTHGGNDVMYGNGNSSAGVGDVMFGGTLNDNMYGDSGDANPNGADGVDGSDVMFGDHGKLYPNLPYYPVFDGFFVHNNFFSIDTQEADGDDDSSGVHNDFEDLMFGNAANDIMIGGQDDDIMFGGAGDDDMIGGHNVAGGMDELDMMSGADVLAITPTVLADLNPADVNDINDLMDGGADDDVMAGDNAIIIRQDDNLSPRFRMTDGGLLYNIQSQTLDNLADIDVGFSANITGAYQTHQDMTLVRTVTLLDHSETIETDAAASPNDPRVFGNDIMAGGSEDDEIFGQLGDDVIQGDGAITLIEQIAEGSFDPYDPAQDADPSFDVRNFIQRVDLVEGNDLDWTVRFDVFEALDDGDDYIEGNGGNDRIYGNLGQDDIIGGSSILFGLGNDDAAFHGVLSGVELRPDGADLIYGGAGNPNLLARNASSDGSLIVPESERHATDADTILGDNGEIYRIVLDTDPETEGDQIGYAVFNYDRDATTADGFVDDGYGDAGLTIRVRAVDLGDYGYAYADTGSDRDTLTFLDTARGEGDLIYGESGDDIIHGMTGDDVIFGNSEHDDLYGEIGADWIVGGTGVDGILGDDGLILTSRNSDDYGESLFGISALLPEQTNLKRNETADPNSLNAEIVSPGNIQRAIINVENELTKSVELFAFRTDDLDGETVGEFDASIAFNDIIFGGLNNDFIHGGDGDDAISAAEALPIYYSGDDPDDGFASDFVSVNTFLQDMQDSTFNPGPALRDNPFWFAFAPYNPGDILRFEGKEILDENGQNARTRDEFAWYDEFNPRRKIVFDFDFNFGAADLGDFTALVSTEGVASPIDFLLNFDETEGELDLRFGEDKASDGDDRIFGDLGNDWIVGGTGRDHMYGGRGNDLLNMDDDHDSGFTGRVGPHDPEPSDLDNKDPDEFQSYADIVYSGAGRDVMILNTGADRAIDWVGEYNSYIVPFSPFGAFHISRTLQPQVPEFLYALSASDGVDNSLNAPDAQLYVDQKNLDVRTDAPDPARALEPYGELGMVRQTDFDWQEQTGAPNDPQPGNLQGKREIMRRELFNDPGAAVPFAADVGTLELTQQGSLQAAPEALGAEVVGLYPLDTLQPSYIEILVTINADKDKAGTKSNGYVLFDYMGAEDFKFAGIDVGTDKLQIGHRDASGWVVDVQLPVQLKANTDYDITVVLFGTQATVYVNENEFVVYDFGEPLNDGGLLGLGTDNAIARFDDFQVQTLPPVWTFVNETGFDSAADNPFTFVTGDWSLDSGSLHGGSQGPLPALAVDSVEVAAFSRLELLGTLATDNQGGFVFDYYSEHEFKFVALDVQNDEVLLGHYLDGNWSLDASASLALTGGVDYSLMLTLFGSTASVTVDGTSVLTHSFNSLLNDGLYGVLSVDGNTSIDSFLVRGDDPAYAGDPLLVEGAARTGLTDGDLDAATIEVAADSAIGLLAARVAVDETQLQGLTIDIADLPGDYLAVYRGDQIVLDYNAAGYGWYTGDDAVVDGVDLLSVLLHEYGHAAGLDHDSALAFMDDSLAVGERFDLSVDVGIAGEGEQSGADTVAVPEAYLSLAGLEAEAQSGQSADRETGPWFAGVHPGLEHIDFFGLLLNRYGQALGIERSPGLAFLADELGLRQDAPQEGDGDGVGLMQVFDEGTGEFISRDARGEGSDEHLIWDGVEAEEGEAGLVRWDRIVSFTESALRLR